jgi:hypothetical protein
MSADTIAKLKITLDDVKPAVLRRVEVPFDIRLDRLHLTIQAAMGWTNSHLYEIRAGDVGWTTPYPDQGDWADDFLDARKARLSDVLEDVGTKTLKYLYDFGDGWEHTIKVERLFDPEPGILYPRLIEAKGHCPPEDVGGPWAMASSLRPSPTPATSGIANSKNGSRTISIPMLSTLIGCPKMLPNWLSAGRANPLSSAAVPPNPRRSTDGYSAAKPMAQRTDHKRHRTLARGVQTQNQDANRTAVSRHRRHAVLGVARFRARSTCAKSMAGKPRHKAHRSAN